MARKQAFIHDPIERTRVAWQAADVELDKAWAKVDAVKLNGKTGNGLPKGVTSDEYNALLAEVEHRTEIVFRACDAWRASVRFAGNLEATNVEHEEAHQIIRDSINYSAEGILWSVNKGLLSHALMESVFKHRVREEPQNAPLCEACS